MSYKEIMLSLSSLKGTGERHPLYFTRIARIIHTSYPASELTRWAVSDACLLVWQEGEILRACAGEGGSPCRQQAQVGTSTIIATTGVRSWNNNTEFKKKNISRITWMSEFFRNVHILRNLPINKNGFSSNILGSILINVNFSTSFRLLIHLLIQWRRVWYDIIIYNAPLQIWTLP